MGVTLLLNKMGHYMEVSLPSGATVELRTALKAKDKFSVQNVIRASADGSASGGILALMETALLARLVEAWSLDDPLPSQHTCPQCVGSSAAWHEHVRDAFGDALDLDDYNELEKTIAPMLEKVMQAPNLRMLSDSAVSS
jgi:hypothetical protein